RRPFVASTWTVIPPITRRSPTLRVNTSMVPSLTGSSPANSRRNDSPPQPTRPAAGPGVGGAGTPRKANGGPPDKGARRPGKPGPCRRSVSRPAHPGVLIGTVNRLPGYRPPLGIPRSLVGNPPVRRHDFRPLRQARVTREGLPRRVAGRAAAE